MDKRIKTLVSSLARQKTSQDSPPSRVEVAKFLRSCFKGAEKYTNDFCYSMHKKHWQDFNHRPIRDWRAIAKAYASRAHLNHLEP